MNVATWNLSRLNRVRTAEDLDGIRQYCALAEADILVLTETDDRVRPEFRHSLSAPTPRGAAFADTEHGVAVYTDYEVVRQYPTSDETGALCVELETERGNVLLYAAVMGLLGKNDDSYMPALTAQLRDIERYAQQGRQLCVCGEFRCDFARSARTYQYEDGEIAVISTFNRSKITAATRGLEGCTSHIAFSDTLRGDAKLNYRSWNFGRFLSDHMGLAIELL